MGAALSDAGGDNPNTIVGTGSGAFLGELIGVTSPTGMPSASGVYDIVFDTCQDGHLRRQGRRLLRGHHRHHAGR